MDAEIIKEIVSAIEQGFTQQALILVVVSLFSAGFGALLGSYLKRKGENLAIQEDFKKILEQQKKTTAELERIRSEVTHDAWLRQKRWEIRREAYVHVLTALFRSQAAEGANLTELQIGDAGHTPEELKQFFERTRREQFEGAIDFYQTLMTALVSVSDEASDVLKGYLEDLSSRASKGSTPDNLKETLDQYQTATANTFARILAIARKELSNT